MTQTSDNDRVEILIIEDSPTQAEQLEHALEQRGYRVTIARDGVEGLASMGARKPTLVITDVIMPHMNGYELCRRIKAEEQLTDIPVILLTSLSDPEDVIRGLECGADAFITKPYNEPYLLTRVQYVLANMRMSEGATLQTGVEFFFSGRRHFVASSRMQILNLLLSTYETAVHQNRELAKARDELSALNEQLEARVRERTAALTQEIAVRERAEQELQARSEELHAMTQQLWHAAKLATMGELAASVAHELNNPLATVTLRVESLLGQIPDSDPQHHVLEVIEQEVDRMARLVASLLQNCGRGTQQISTLDAREELDNTIELIDYHLRNLRIEVVREFDDRVPMFLADRQQLRQLFLNLFTNAADAMPSGGTLTVRLTASPPGNQPGEDPTDIVIEITDIGAGIPSEHLSKIFEPFFTTKPEGKGTGLGMGICRRIVEDHGGKMQITSMVGEGTTVRIQLPTGSQANKTWAEGSPADQQVRLDA